MSRVWRYLFPCYLFTVVMTVAGLVIATVAYRARGWAWYDGVLGCVAGTHPDGTTRIWGQPNAQTLGWIVVYDSEAMRNEADLRVHEYAHVAQSFAGALVGLALCPLLFMAVGWSPLLGLTLGGFIGGLGFALLYGLLFLYLWARNGGNWFVAYWNIPFEVQAREVQDKYLRDGARAWGV